MSPKSPHTTASDEVFDYIIVGSGPGGGPLAANLARHGHSVLLLEAGDDQGQNLNGKIPAFFAPFEEDPAERWDFFVKHYSDPKEAAKDPKMTWRAPDGSIFVGTNPPPGSKQLGIYYPRSGTLGGCAAHNALVSILPPDQDWEHIAKLTGDESWKAAHIRPLFQRLERNHYLPKSTAGHGFEGWLETNLPDESSIEAGEAVLTSTLAVVNGEEETSVAKALIRDINSLHPETKDGVYQQPLQMSAKGRRSSPRNYLVATANAKNSHGRQKYPLHIRTHCLATRVLFDDHKPKHGHKPRAIGIEYLKGQSVYKADPRFNSSYPAIKSRAYASKEVIIGCGVFNTPQLLKLSGIGPKAELEKFGIDVIVDLPGVGTNLQDNYEFSVVANTKASLSPFQKGTGLAAGDPLFEQWINSGGPYASNGVPAVILHTTSAAHSPDLLIFGGGFDFHGFFPGYSRAITSQANNWTWDVLQIRPENTRGTVTLRSSDPRDVPEINFRYFDQGGDADTTAMAEGVKLARRINAGVAGPSAPFDEILPGKDVDTPAEIKTSIRNEAFGHHASCTCAIGADDDPMACLDSRFRVRGVEGLRVVDASAFPRIMGPFPTLPLYIVSEKATDVILEDAKSSGDDKVLDGVRELEVLIEDAWDNAIVFEQAEAEKHKHHGGH